MSATSSNTNTNTQASGKMARPTTSVRDLQARAYMRWVEEGEAERQARKERKNSKGSAKHGEEESQPRRQSLRDLYARYLA